MSIQVNEPGIGARACFSIGDSASRVTFKSDHRVSRGASDDRGIRRCPHPILVTRRVRIVSAAWRVIGTCGSSADGSGTHTYRHSTGYGTVNATAMNAAVINPSATNASATTTSIGEGVS
jgi:hypothetical protein